MVQQRRKRDKYLQEFQHMHNYEYYHRDFVDSSYMKEMESVVLMSDHAGEEYSKALTSDLSTDDEEERSWVKNHQSCSQCVC